GEQARCWTWAAKPATGTPRSVVPFASDGEAGVPFQAAATASRISTTASHGTMTGKPTSTAVSPSASTTTPLSTKANGPSATTPTNGPPSSPAPTDRSSSPPHPAPSAGRRELLGAPRLLELLRA